MDYSINSDNTLNSQGFSELLLKTSMSSYRSYTYVLNLQLMTMFAIHTLIYSQPIYFSGYLNRIYIRMFKMNYVGKLGTKSHEGINIKQRL